MAKIGTATLTVEPKIAEGFVFPHARSDALAKAILSVSRFETPPTASHIVERAAEFLEFLDPPA